MAPDVVLIDSPTGSPVADHEEIVAVDDESEAVLVKAEMALPEMSS